VTRKPATAPTSAMTPREARVAVAAGRHDDETGDDRRPDGEAQPGVAFGISLAPHDAPDLTSHRLRSSTRPMIMVNAY